MTLSAGETRLRAALDELLDVAERSHAGDPNLDPEQWYAARDYAKSILRDTAMPQQCPHPDKCGHEGCHGCVESVTSRMKS